MAKRVLGCSGIDIAKEWECFDLPVLVHSIVGHVYISLTNCLTLDTTKVDSLLHGIILDDFDEGEAVHGE
jgi:hypothetical protein